jgi:HAD superfamily hydrolase (TIGR01509 family)
MMNRLLKYLAVIFDFNGTLFWDTALHNATWDRYLKDYNIQLSDTEKHLRLHGKNNRQIVQDLFGHDVSEEEIARISREKELRYQEMVIEKNLQLADGAEELLIFLKQESIPVSIVTASDKLNVDFFIEYLNLTRWFDPDRIIFNDGTMKGKPDPEMFLLAMQRMDAKPEETVIFEDSETGITAAHRARPGKLFIVNSTESDYSHWKYPVISSFREVNRDLFI